MKRLFLTIVALMAVMQGFVRAQTASTVFVSGTEGFTDCISLSQGSSDRDIIVKFTFNEAKNTLTVSLVSYRGLFVFKDYTRYSKVFQWSTFKPQGLSYEIAVPPKCRWKSSPEFKKSIGKKFRKYVFSRWIEYDGLQAVPTEYNMLGDKIEQTFDILQKRAVVSVTLRDILLVDPAGKEGRYNFVFGKDVMKRYNVAILRNLCFGKEAEIKASEDALSSVKSAYDSLSVTIKKMPSKASAEYREVLESTKSLMLKQFQKKDTDNECACISENLENYNSYVDKIAKTVVPKPKVAPKPAAPKGINADRMLARARKIDLSISRWLVSTDPVERRDLAKSCRSIIAAAKEEIRTKGVYTQAQKDARDAILAAEEYFNRTCK